MQASRHYEGCSNHNMMKATAILIIIMLLTGYQIIELGLRRSIIQ